MTTANNYALVVGEIAAGSGAGPRGANGRGRRSIATVLQLTSQTSMSFGSSLAGIAIPIVGGVVVVAVRQLMTALFLLPVTRPRVRGRTLGHFLPAVWLGVALAVMNVSFYEAIGRIELGTVVTIEYLGPLAIALLGARRLLDLLCAIAAGVGVVILAGGGVSALDPLGVGLSVLAGVGWASYILLTRLAGERFPGLEGLALASVVSLLLTAPVALFVLDFSGLTWPIVGLLVAIGILCSAIPYSLDIIVLRRITPRLYSIITALAPASATLMGWLVLGQVLSGWQLFAIGLVCTAAITAIATQRNPRATELEATAATTP
ncbi:MAG TPA: EamA family transporter [Terrimesophilobacter sp.]|nr:EamA family transporter [Terrimesophilobacter sp.]